MMEEWSDGVVDNWINEESIIPVMQFFTRTENLQSF